jgi:hypothetical protein
MFFVNVASKGLSVSVSGLESILAGIPVNTDSKEVRLQKRCAIPRAGYMYTQSVS